MKELPIGIQNFRKIIEGNYVYVDKTQYVHALLANASYYFLSRPRRFGKSLLLDTIGEAFNELFSHNKEIAENFCCYAQVSAIP